MITRRTVITLKALALAVVGALVFGVGTAVPANDKDDAKSIEGTWQVISQWTNGKEDTIAKDGGDMVTLNDGKVTIKQGDKDACKGTFTLDSTKTPMTIDKTMADGEEKGKITLGIYKRTGDELKVSWSRPGETDRPADLEAKSYKVTTLKRVKS